MEAGEPPPSHLVYHGASSFIYKPLVDHECLDILLSTSCFMEAFWDYRYLSKYTQAFCLLICFVLFCETGFPVLDLLLCRSSWLQMQRPVYLCLTNAGIKGGSYPRLAALLFDVGSGDLNSGCEAYLPTFLHWWPPF